MAPAKERKNVILIFICNVHQKERICIVEHASMFSIYIIFIIQNKYRYLILVIQSRIMSKCRVLQKSYNRLVCLSFPRSANPKSANCRFCGRFEYKKKIKPVNLQICALRNLFVDRTDLVWLCVTGLFMCWLIWPSSPATLS